LAFFIGVAALSSNRAPRPAGARKPVRIRRSEIGKRLAQQDILQAQGEGILAKGEIPETWRDSIEILQRKY
jgi:hypothetical protein